MAKIPIAQLIATKTSRIIMFGYSPAQLLSIINEIRIWSVAVTAIAGVVTFAASYYQIRLQSIVGAEKDANFEEFRLGSEKRVEELRLETSKALAEQESIKNDNLKLGLELEKERQQRLILELRLAPRSVTKEQTEALRRALAAAPRPFTAQVSVVDNPEAQKYANQLEAALKAAGLTIADRATLLANHAEGLFLIVRDQTHPHSQAIAAAFINANIDANREIGATESDVHLVVGFKP